MGAQKEPARKDAAGGVTSIQWVPASPFTTFSAAAQVCGVCFDDQGEVLVLSPDGKSGWNLPGGKPESGETWRVTLQRQVREQAGAELGEIALLGAFAVAEGGRAPYFRLRCAARIVRPDPPTAVPAKGETFVRRMIPAAQFMDIVAIEDERPVLASALRWLEKHPVRSTGVPGPAATGEKAPGGKNPALPETRGFNSGSSPRAGSAAPRPRRRAGLG